MLFKAAAPFYPHNYWTIRQFYNIVMMHVDYIYSFTMKRYDDIHPFLKMLSSVMNLMQIENKYYIEYLEHKREVILTGKESDRPKSMFICKDAKL